jgi:RNA polymerase sigma-70 factor (ECF subfamily)
MHSTKTNDDEFDKIVARYYAKILAYCNAHLMGGLSVAEDCAQDIFLVLYNNMHKLRDFEKIGGWLYKTASNITKQYAAAIQKQRRHLLSIHDFENEEVGRLTPESLIQIVDFDSFEEQHIDIGVCVKMIRRRLNKDELDIWRLSFQEAHSIREIACELGISESAAKSRVYRLYHKALRLAHEVAVGGKNDD